jgi:serine/threonine protein kinase
MQKNIADKYEIVRLLGEGTYGKVYLVQHKDLNVRYALKVLNSQLSNDQMFIEQFKNEAEMLLRFTHEGCIQVRDFGKLENGLYYMATDFCDGGTLKDLIYRNGRLDPVYTMQLLTQILSALEAAHSRGIIHRDIKPENIMIIRDYKGSDVVKVLDFGISKIFGLENELETSSQGFIFGTPEYMSPEQAYGDKDLDFRADIYSTGIMAYEMMTGKIPFHSESLVQLLLMHVTQPPQPFAQKLNISKYVEEIIFRAISKDKTQRYTSAQEFMHDCLKATELLELERKSITKQKTESTVFKRPEIIDEVITQDTQSTIESNSPSKQAESSTLTPQNSEEEKENITTDNSETSQSDDSFSILCLDDDVYFLNLLTHILEHEGYNVLSTTQPSQIHSYLFTNNVKVLITDVQMPDMPGTKVCKMLKSRLPNLKIALFSNLPERDLEALAAESKADSCMSKQARPVEWLELVRSLAE